MRNVRSRFSEIVWPNFASTVDVWVSGCDEFPRTLWVFVNIQKFLILLWRTRRCVLIVFSRYRSPCALPIRMTGALSTHGLFDAVGLGTVEELVAACVTRFNVGFDFATILSSPFSSCILFAIVSRQLVELEFWEQQIKLKWMMLKKWRRLYHSSRVKFPFVNISASWCVVSTYLIWIFRFILLLPTSKYMRSGYMSHCWTSAFDDHDNHCCLKGVEHRTELRRRHVWGNIIDIA